MLWFCVALQGVRGDSSSVAFPSLYYAQLPAHWELPWQPLVVSLQGFTLITEETPAIRLSYLDNGVLINGIGLPHHSTYNNT